MRLIDADALIEAHYNYCNTHHGEADIFWTWSLRLMKDAPTIEAEPRRRGLWIFRTNAFITKDGSQFAGYKCSECGNAVWHGGNFCPNCGAKMEEQE